MFTTTVLLLSHDKSLRDAVSQVGHSIRNCEIESCISVAEAMKILSHSDVSLGLVHVAKPEDETIVPEFLWESALAHETPSVLVLSDQYCPEVALEYFRLGVADYLSRPLDLGRLARLMEELTMQARCMGSRKQPTHLLSPVESDLMRQIQTAAQGESTILLTGETGTGKSRLARLIHEMSPRRGRPFLAINCGSLSPSLMESEMFGHAKGAFTGADRQHSGKFSDVADGTMFLDEIDTLDPVMQAKLLRVIESREFESVGSNKTIAMRARLIVASNRDLEVEVAEKRFRQDLFFRIKVVDFNLPPLRDRIGDVPILAQVFLSEFVSRDQSPPGNKRPVPKLTTEALKAFEAYHWPGNIRELRNVIERLVLLCPGSVIQLKDLPPQFHECRSVVRHDMATNGKPVGCHPAATLSDEMAHVIEAMERRTNGSSRKDPTSDEMAHVIEAMERRTNGSSRKDPTSGEMACVIEAMERRTNGSSRKDPTSDEMARVIETMAAAGNNCTKAAQTLGISRAAFYKKLHKLGILP